jgi:hypothetical protein
MAVSSFRPDRYDPIGAAICLIGVAVVRLRTVSQLTRVDRRHVAVSGVRHERDDARVNHPGIVVCSTKEGSALLPSETDQQRCIVAVL